MRDTRLDSLITAFDKADAIRQALISEKADKITRLSEIEEYLAYKDEVTETLLTIQREMQSGTTESYEALLTDLLHMVMPNDPANHRVVMSHYIKNNAVSLKTEIETVDGYRHDIYEDKGQSVENIMALCLRFLALGRTSNRRFLLFDESDHGVMPSYMGKFSEVLYQLTYRIGMQVVYISHHDWRLFEGKARIIELSKDGDSISANIISEPDPEIGAEFNSDILDHMSGIGLTDITLKNFKAHMDTTIELSPFLNVIIGPMDLGKSSVISGLDSLKRNKGGESKIRDGQREMSVEIGVEEGLRLLWSYDVDAPKKSKYVLYNSDGGVIKMHQGAKEIPEFLDDYLAMPLHMGYDLHIADSHDSSFIFAKHISEAKAADILSFSEETTQAQDMLVQHKDNIAAYKKEQKQLQSSINKLKSKLNVLSHLDGGDRELLIGARARLRDNNEKMFLEILDRAKNIERCYGKVEAMKALSTIEKYPESSSTFVSKADVSSRKIYKYEMLIDIINRASSRQYYSEKPKGFERVSFLIGKIAPMEKRLMVIQKARSIETPNKPYIDERIFTKPELMKKQLENKAAILFDAKSMEDEIREINNNIKNAIQHNGGVCPLCQSQL